MNILISFFALFSVANCIQFDIPEVAAVVGETIHKYHDYVHYNGSDLDAPNITTRGEAGELEKRQANPYWMEAIPHQGVAAFGASGYKVYRNVKDYGAKGLSSSHFPLLRWRGRVITDIE